MNKLFKPGWTAVVLITLLSAAIYSCKKKEHHDSCACNLAEIEGNDCSTDTTEIMAMLNGKFAWKASFNPWTGISETPKSSGKTEELEFLNNHQVRVYRNGSYYTEGYWWFEYQSGMKMYVTDSLYQPFSDSISYSGWVRKCGGCLVIDLSPVDGQRLTFGKN